MILSKRCPKCGGNLVVGSDYYGTYASCMQCGTSMDLPNGNSNQTEVVEAVSLAIPATRTRRSKKI